VTLALVGAAITRQRHHAGRVQPELPGRGDGVEPGDRAGDRRRRGHVLQPRRQRGRHRRRRGLLPHPADRLIPTTAFTPLTPSPTLDTRSGIGGFSGPINRNETIAVSMAGAGPVPADAKAVVLNVTVVNGTADSYLTVSGGFSATTSNLNFEPGQTKQMLVIASIAANGQIEIYNHVGSVDVVADVFGYFA
jgi:hypothetical protein